MCKLISTLILICRLHTARNAQGISVRTQEIYLLVALSRYTDLLTVFYSLYNSIMKVVYIALHALVILLIRCNHQISSTYDQQQDNFNHWKFIVLPCAVLGSITFYFRGWEIRHFYDIQGLLWTFSILLESVAILPQLRLLRRYRVVENLTGNYVFFMGLHRIFYIGNWIYRAHHEEQYRHNLLLYSCAALQSLLYVDFIYCWVTSKIRGHELSYGGEGDVEYYDCDVSELRNYENSTSLIDNSDIRVRGKTESSGDKDTKASLSDIMPVV